MLVLATTLMNVGMTVTFWFHALNHPEISVETMALITAWAALNVLAAIRILGPRR